MRTPHWTKNLFVLVALPFSGQWSPGSVLSALGTVAGGAVGNVIDRLRLGYVVDFIHAHAWGWSWYVFNVADAAIVCGVGALVLEGIIARPSAGPARDHLADGPDRR